MSYTYLLEQGEESSAACYSDIEPSVRSRLTSTAAKFCCNDSETESCPGSRSGMTCEHSMVPPTEAMSTSCAAASHVRTSVSPEKERGSTANVPGCGPSSPASFAKFDPATCSWKTRQRSLTGGLIEFSETWPKWGTTVCGESYRRKTPAGLEAHRQLIISAKESGFSGEIGTPTTCHTGRSEKFKTGRRPTPQEIAERTTVPTPSASDGSRGGVLTPNMSGTSLPQFINTQRVPTPHGFSKDGKSNGPSGNELGRAVNQMQRVPTPCSQDAKNATLPPSQGGRDSIPGFLIREGETTGGSLNPTWVEWLMGWPLGWTDLKPLATDKFQQWLLSHGNCCTHD